MACVGCGPSQIPVQSGNGFVGTELREMLVLIGIHAHEACGCEEFSLQMDAWGIDGCVTHRAEIIEQLRKAQSATSWLDNLSAAVGAIRIGVAAKLNPWDPIPGLVDEAIRRAARKIGRLPPGIDTRPHLNREGDPRPSDALTPIPSEFRDVRNLIYHIWPTRKSNNWRWNVRQLLARIELFNGVRSIGVATDNNTVTLDEVKAEFGDTRIDHWIEQRNNPTVREGTTFLGLMSTLPRDDSVTCYAHAKGVRHDDQSLTLRWAEMLYRANLDRWSEVAKALANFPIAGAFKRYGQFKVPKNNHWHFSGTFFWFRNADTFSRAEWSYLSSTFFACVEAWPANVFRATEAACLFGDNAGDLYDAGELQRHMERLAELEKV